MWPFGGEQLSDRVNYAPYGSTKLCKGCGVNKFKRRYNPAYDWEIGLSPHMEAICVSCGWWRGEQLRHP